MADYITRKKEKPVRDGLMDAGCVLLALVVIAVCVVKIILRNVIWIKFPVIFALGIILNALLMYRNYRRYHKYYRVFFGITVVLMIVFAAVTFG